MIYNSTYSALSLKIAGSPNCTINAIEQRFDFSNLRYATEYEETFIMPFSSPHETPFLISTIMAPE